MQITPTILARLAGLFMVLMAPIGFFGMMYVSTQLVDATSIAQTTQNILDSEEMFRWSMLSTYLMNLDVMALGLALYWLLKRVNKPVAVIMLLLIMFGAGISLMSELNHYAVLNLATNNLNELPIHQKHHLIHLFLDMRYYGSFGIAQIFWSIWLFPLAYLIIQSNFIPDLLGWLIALAGMCYFIKCILLFLRPELSFVILDYLTFGEMLFGLWLLLKGVSKEEWEVTIPNGIN